MSAFSSSPGTPADMETVSMSYEELDRARVIERRLTQREAARVPGVTSRQVRRLQRPYGRGGSGGLAPKHRGRPSNRRLPMELRREAWPPSAHRTAHGGDQKIAGSQPKLDEMLSGLDSFEF